MSASVRHLWRLVRDASSRRLFGPMRGFASGAWQWSSDALGPDSAFDGLAQRLHRGRAQLMRQAAAVSTAYLAAVARAVSFVRVRGAKAIHRPSRAPTHPEKMPGGRARNRLAGLLASARHAADASDALPLARSCVMVAASNLLQHKLRLAAALSGIAVALFLLLLQISVLEASRTKVTALFDDFDYDMVVVPDTYQFLLSFDTVDRIVLDIARATGDVSDTFGLNVDVVHWMQLPSKQMTYNFLIGLDNPGSFVRDRDIRAGWDSLRSPHSILADRYSQNSVGPVSIGTDAQIGDERVTVTGQFKLGLFFYAEGGTIVRNTNFPRLSGRDPRMISIALLKLKPGISADKAKADLIRALPSHTLVMTRDELLKEERAYFLSTKPIGVMIYISMLIACLVGGAIIVQVLSTEVSNRMNEYAVLKAMGSGPVFVYGIGMVQAGLLGLGGLVPAALLGALVLELIEYRTHLGTSLSLGLGVTMLAITLALASTAGAAVVRRVQQADPAELF